MTATLFDAQREADEAIAQVEANADLEWRDRAYNALCDWLRTHPTFHTDDIWTVLDEPREARAFGAVVRRVSREGLMVQSGQFRPSVRSRGTQKPVWRSEVFSA